MTDPVVVALKTDEVIELSNNVNRTIVIPITSHVEATRAKAFNVDILSADKMYILDNVTAHTYNNGSQDILDMYFSYGDTVFQSRFIVGFAGTDRYISSQEGPENSGIKWTPLDSSTMKHNMLVTYEGFTFTHTILFSKEGDVSVVGISVVSKLLSDIIGPLVTLRSSIVDAPRIVIFSVTDPLWGANAGQTIYRVTQENGWVEYNKRLTITRYARPTTLCTLVQKVNAFNLEMRALVLYSALRVFLWFLIKGVWDFSILVRSRSKEFFTALAGSEYRIYIEAFESDQLRGYGKYFVKC